MEGKDRRSIEFLRILLRYDTPLEAEPMNERCLYEAVSFLRGRLCEVGEACRLLTDDEWCNVKISCVHMILQ